MKFSIFTAEKNLCILHVPVFVMFLTSNHNKSFYGGMIKKKMVKYQRFYTNL